MADVEHAKGMFNVLGIQHSETEINGEIRFCVSKGNNSIDYNRCPMTIEEFCAYARGIGDAMALIEMELLREQAAG